MSTLKNFVFPRLINFEKVLQHKFTFTLFRRLVFRLVQAWISSIWRNLTVFQYFRVLAKSNCNYLFSQGQSRLCFEWPKILSELIKGIYRGDSGFQPQARHQARNSTLMTSILSFFNVRGVFTIQSVIARITSTTHVVVSDKPFYRHDWFVAQTGYPINQLTHDFRNSLTVS